MNQSLIKKVADYLVELRYVGGDGLFAAHALDTIALCNFNYRFIEKKCII